MRSIVNLRLDIVHEANLPLDAQGIADFVERALTERIKSDRLASTRATLNGAVIENARDAWELDPVKVAEQYAPAVVNADGSPTAATLAMFGRVAR